MNNRVGRNLPRGLSNLAAGYAFPLAAIVVAVAVVIFASWYFSTLAMLPKGVDRASDFGESVKSEVGEYGRQEREGQRKAVEAGEVRPDHRDSVRPGHHRPDDHGRTVR